MTVLVLYVVQYNNLNHGIIIVAVQYYTLARFVDTAKRKNTVNPRRMGLVFEK